MNILLELECDLKLLNNFSKKLAKKTKVGDIFFLSGDLGTGKTTFTRLFINSIFDTKNITRPKNIKSPSYPIMINYSLAKYEICHYDLYRLKHKSELLEIGILEDFKNNISIIEWPELILNNFSFTDYYLIQFEVINKYKRLLKIKHTNKNKL